MTPLTLDLNLEAQKNVTPMDQWSKSTSAPLCRELISFLESIETVVRLDGMLDAATTGPPDSPKFEPYGGLAFSGSPATAESSGPDADF